MRLPCTAATSTMAIAVPATSAVTSVSPNSIRASSQQPVNRPPHRKAVGASASNSPDMLLLGNKPIAMACVRPEDAERIDRFIVRFAYSCS